MILGLAGYGGSGKDAVASYLVEHHQFTRVAFADPIKEMALRQNPTLAISVATQDRLCLNRNHMTLQQGLSEVLKWVETYWDEIQSLPLEYRHAP